MIYIEIYIVTIYTEYEGTAKRRQRQEVSVNPVNFDRVRFRQEQAVFAQNKHYKHN